MAHPFTGLPSSPGAPGLPSSPASPFNFSADVQVEQDINTHTRDVSAKKNKGIYRRSSITRVSFRSCIVVILPTDTLLDSQVRKPLQSLSGSNVFYDLRSCEVNSALQQNTSDIPLYLPGLRECLCLLCLLLVL